MSDLDWGGLGLLAWLVWSVACAAALRLALAYAGRRFLGLADDRAKPLAYLAGAGVFVGSFFLHGAILGPGVMYGGTPREGYSLVAYIFAPFGLPLLVGSVGILIIDLGRAAFSDSAWGK